MPAEASGSLGLSSGEVSAVLSLLSSGPDASLGASWESFGKVFGGSPAKELRGGLALAALFRFQDFVPLPAARLHALHALHRLQPKRPPLELRPYTPLFAALARPNAPRKQDGDEDLVQLSPQERHFVLLLLAGGAGAQGLAKATPAKVLGGPLGQPPPVDLAALEAKLREAQGPLCMDLRPALSPYPDTAAHLTDQSEDLGKSLAAVLMTSEATGPLPAALGSLVPEFIRPAPPMHEGEDEYVFLHSVEASQFVPLFDEDMLLEEAEEEEEDGSSTADTSAKDTDSRDTTVGTLSPPSSPAKARSEVAAEAEADGEGAEALLAKALTTTLMVNQANWLSEEVRRRPELAAAVGMSPEKLPSLVEANPSVAVGVLLGMEGEKEAYFGALVRMEVTVHGMEVVNRLTCQVELGEEFMAAYVGNCVGACEALAPASLAQNRLVRLVCVFVQAMLRNKVFAFSPALTLHLQGFCLNFSKIKEAAALFKMLQASSSSPTHSPK